MVEEWFLIVTIELEDEYLWQTRKKFSDREGQKGFYLGKPMKGYRFINWSS